MRRVFSSLLRPYRGRFHCGLSKIERSGRVALSPVANYGSTSFGQYINLPKDQPLCELLTSFRRLGPNLEQPLPAVIENVALDVESRCIRIFWNDSTEDDYPFVWLRDNCQCTNCFNSDANGRLVILTEMDTKITPTFCSVVNGRLTVGWPNGHISMLLRLPDPCEKIRSEIQIVLWGSEMQDQIPTYDYNVVADSDAEFYRCLSDLNEAGLVVMRNTPRQDDFLMDFTNRIGFPFESHYGKTFVVKNKTAPSNVAYTGKRLGLHVDLPFYVNIPDFQFLHCIEQFQGQGGDNDFVDAFNVAYQLREEDPQAFDILSNFKVDMWDYGSDHTTFYKVTSKPIICLSREGQVVGINHNNQVRDSILNIPAEFVQTFYDALKKFNQMLYYPRNLIRYKLEPGELIMFANFRVLHGRNGYDVETPSERHLVGAYITMDELRSKIRVLGHKLDYY